MFPDAALQPCEHWRFGSRLCDTVSKFLSRPRAELRNACDRTARKVRVVQKLPTPLRHVRAGEMAMVKAMQREDLRTRKKWNRGAMKADDLPAGFSWARYADTRLQQLEEATAGDAARDVKCAY